jgi:hypothetical protein
MSLHSWLHSLCFALAPGRGHPRRRGSSRAGTRRPSVEVLEDRHTPSLFLAYYTADEPPGVGWPPVDFTSDGIVDQLSLNGAHEVAVRPGLGDGTYGDPILSYALYAGAPAVADFDGDGRLDVATVAQESGPPTVTRGSVLLGRGDGTFLDWDFYEADYIPYPNQIKIADIGGDGRMDVVVGGWADAYGQEYVFAVLLNDGIWPNTPQLRIGDVSVNEGNTGVVEAVFTVALDYGADQPVTVQYATADGSATAGSDYQAVSSTLTFAPGETSKTITVPVYGDRLFEPNETFVVYLSSPTNALLADGEGQGTIVDDEPHSYLSIASASRSEGNIGQTPIAFAVTLSSASDAPVTVDWTTTDGGATAGSDYQAASGTLTFAPGETTKTITVQVIGDRLPEQGESFRVLLNNPTNAFIAGSEAFGTILDDEPRISISDVTRREGRKNTTQFVFTVTLSAAYDQSVTMSFQTVNGTATTGDGDYVARAGTLTFAPGETTKTITIEVKGDRKRETNEYFYLDLFDKSSNSLFTKNRGIGSILNDD